MTDEKPCCSQIAGLRICKQCSDSDHDNVLLNAFLDRQHVAALDCQVSARLVHINVLYVKPTFRDRGIAHAMLDFLRDDFPGREIDCLQTGLQRP